MWNYSMPYGTGQFHITIAFNSYLNSKFLTSFWVIEISLDNDVTSYASFDM